MKTKKMTRPAEPVEGKGLILGEAYTDSVAADRVEVDPRSRPYGLLVREARRPLGINGIPAAEFIKRAFDLGHDLNGPGRYEIDDPVQSELRHIKGWIESAERDALDARNAAPMTKGSR